MNKASPERRQTARQPHEEPLLVQITAIDETSPPEGLTTTCRTVNVSAGGLRLRLNERIESGSQIDLWVEVTGRPGKLLLSGEVRWSVQDGKSYLVGVQLHDRAGFDLLAWKALLKA